MIWQAKYQIDGSILTIRYSLTHLRTLSPSLVWCNHNVGGDEKSPVFSWRNHIVRFVPDLTNIRYINDRFLITKIWYQWDMLTMKLWNMNPPVRTSWARWDIKDMMLTMKWRTYPFIHLAQDKISKICWRWINKPTRSYILRKIRYERNVDNKMMNPPVHTSCAWLVVHWHLLRRTASTLSPKISTMDNKRQKRTIEMTPFQKFCRFYADPCAKTRENFLTGNILLPFPKLTLVKYLVNFSGMQVPLGS